MAVYEVGANNTLTSVKKVLSYTKEVDILTVEDLSSSKTYVAYVYGMNDGNGELYEIAFLAKQSAETSRVLTGIKINGSAWDISGLSGNSATISDGYAGPPTVQFIYTINYEDNTTKTGKTENVVAVKDGTSYVATSTALTTNVSLTFTSVSNVLFSMTDPTAPTEALDSKTSSAVTATFSPGGSATVYNGHSSNASVMVDANNGINLAGSGNSYFKASFPSPLAEGDVIESSNTAGAFFISNTNDRQNSQTMPYTIPSGSNLIGKTAVFIQKDVANAFTWLTITRAKTIDSQTLGGVKKGSNTLTAGTDYTISETTITLAEAHKSIVAPTDIKLINLITYDDASTEDKDVNVTLVENEDFFEGTATIGATTYTVKVPVDNSTPLLALSAASGSISLNSYTPAGSVKVTLTGTNLANGTFTAPTAEGVTVTPTSVEITDGTINQEFTISSTATTTASTAIVFAYDGAESQTYTLSYSKTAKRELTQTDVTEATTWDWTKSGGASIELKADTDPANGAEFILSDLPEINNDETFNAQTLKVSCQWPNRGTNYYFQGNVIKFNTTVPGTVQVWFSNTSNRTDTEANRRFLYVNDVNSGVYTLDQTFVNTEAMPVPMGEVIISAKTGEDDATMVRINKIVFTPAAATTISLNAKGYATYSNYYDVAVSGAKVYTAELDFNNAKITCHEVSSGKVPAGQGVLLYGTAGAEVTLTPTTGAGDLINNQLHATTLADGTLASKGDGDCYSLNGDTFMKYTGTSFVANKAYFEVLSGGSFSARSFTIEFVDGGYATAIDGVSAAERSADSVYDLQGRRVEKPVKGLYVVNGKKVVIK